MLKPQDHTPLYKRNQLKTSDTAGAINPNENPRRVLTLEIWHSSQQMSGSCAKDYPTPIPYSAQDHWISEPCLSNLGGQNYPQKMLQRP